MGCVREMGRSGEIQEAAKVCQELLTSHNRKDTGVREGEDRKTSGQKGLLSQN